MAFEAATDGTKKIQAYTQVAVTFKLTEAEQKAAAKSVAATIRQAVLLPVEPPDRAHRAAGGSSFVRTITAGALQPT